MKNLPVLYVKQWVHLAVLKSHNPRQVLTYIINWCIQLRKDLDNMHGIETIKNLNDKCRDNESELLTVTELLNGRGTTIDKGSNKTVTDQPSA